MTHEEKITLIDDMIREDPNYRIIDYLMLVADIESIEKNITMPYPGITEAERRRILSLAANMTAAQIRKETNVAFSTIYRVLKDGDFNVKEATRLRRLFEKQRSEDIKKREEAERITRIKARQIALEPEKKPIIIRPPAQYSNHSPFGIADTLHQQKTA